MEHLEHPPLEVWEARRARFERVDEESRGEGSYLVSEQASAVSADVQCAYCAGAWVAVICLSMAAVEATLREVEVPGFAGNTKQLLTEAGVDPRLQHLRLRRNALIHVHPHNPALTVEHQWAGRDTLEKEAQIAVELMFSVIYRSPGT
jgi:hypothetical protein